LVFIFNLLFCILGLVMIGVGAWAYDDDKFLDKVDVNFEELAEVTKDHFSKVGIAMMVLGAIMTIVALCGVLGALFENQCCLAIFFVLLFLCFLVTFAATVLLFYVGASGDEGLKKYYKVVTDQAWTELSSTRFQEDNNCCGKDEEPDENCEFNYEKGCFEALAGLFKPYIVVAGCVMLGIAVIVLLGMSMACVLCCGIKRSYAAV